MPVRVCRHLCVPLCICLSSASLTHHQTSHAEGCYRQHCILHGFSKLQTCSHLCNAQGSSGGPACFGILWKCELGSTVLGSEHRAHWNTLGPQTSFMKSVVIVWSETLTLVSCWSFDSSHLAQKSGLKIFSRPVQSNCLCPEISSVLLRLSRETQQTFCK